MPILENSKQEAFAQRIAAGARVGDAYVAAGYSAKAAQQCGSRLLTDKRIRARVNEIRKEISDRMVNASIKDVDNRVGALQDRWERMKRIIDERAADPSMQEVPGGKTGLLVRRIKAVKATASSGAAETGEEGEHERSVKYSIDMDEFAVDTGLLKEMRELELQAAKELGQLTQKMEVTGSINLVERLNAGRKRIASEATPA